MNRLRPTFRFFALSLLLLPAACGAPEIVEKMPAVYYPAPPAAPRVQFLRSVTVGSDIEEGRSGLDTLLFGEAEIEKKLMAPYGVTLHDDIFYVCDIQQSAVLTIDLENGELSFIKVDGRGGLQKPVNLAFAPDDRLFVADLGRRQVVVYDSEFRFIKELGPFGEASKIVDVEIAHDKLYCLDAGLGEVRIFDLNTYEELLVFNADEEQEVKLVSPTNMVVDEEGNIYVVDTVQCQLFVWDQEGKFDRTIGSPGDIVGQFARPKGVALSDGLLFILDASFENCQIFNMEGDPLMFFANAGVDPGNLYLPACVWVGEDGLELFEDYLDDGFEATKLIAITNLYGPFKLNFYAFGTVDGYDYTENEAARGLADIGPESETETED